MQRDTDLRGQIEEILRHQIELLQVSEEYADIQVIRQRIDCLRLAADVINKLSIQATGSLPSLPSF